MRDERDMKQEVAADLELIQLMDRNVENLSAGELQRVTIASAALRNGDIFLFDEVSTFLDVRQRLEAAQIVRSLVRPNNYVIVAEHDLSVLDYLSDFICCLYGKPGVYGAVTLPFSGREGINIFLSGFVPAENLRFRDESLTFKASPNITCRMNLQTLKGVCNFKCDEVMIRRIPNIKKLGLFYREDEATESHDDDSCLHNIERLQKLESFSCYCFRRCDFLQNLTFPNSLKSLTLEIKYGRNEDILEKVSTPPLLQKLELKNGSFTTGKWETVEGQFPSLKFLSLAYCRHLEWWTMESSHFPCLMHLRLWWLDLNEIPAELGEIATLKTVTLEQCRESAVKSAKRMVEEQEELQGVDQLSFKVAVSLWLGNNEDLLSLANPNFQVTAPQVVHRSDGYVDVIIERL